MTFLVSNRFELIERVGQGTFAEVWRARDLQRSPNTTDVALKIFRPEGCGDETQPWEPVYREVVAGAQMPPHPNVLSSWGLTYVRYFGEDETPCLIMDYVTGANLAEWLAGQPPPGPQSFAVRWSVMSGLLRGLAHTHGARVTHNDVTFGNVMVRSGPSTEALLTDFGCSQTEDQAPTLLAQPEDVDDLQPINPPPYVSPWADGARRDVYAFAILCYLAFVGRHPLTDDWQAMRRGQWQGINHPHRNLPRRSIAELAHWTWTGENQQFDALADLLLRCVSPDPAMRPASAVEALSSWEAIGLRADTKT